MRNSAHIKLTNPHVFKIFKALVRGPKPVHKIYQAILKMPGVCVSPVRINRSCQGLRELGYLEAKKIDGAYMTYRINALGRLTYENLKRGKK